MCVLGSEWCSEEMHKDLDKVSNLLSGAGTGAETGRGGGPRAAAAPGRGAAATARGKQSTWSKLRMERQVRDLTEDLYL